MFQDQLAEKVRPFIDLIDDMRSIGIDKELPLPTIAVVGDQSSGKSSVLETLSGVALPRGTGIVTRCPLLLQLYKQTNNRQVLFHQYFPIDLTAQNVLAGKGVGICEDLITLKITSSTVCDLSLIDLPGITRVAVKGQPDDIGAHIKNLILKFIKNKRTIILVVVPCNVDIATTEALKMAQEMDPEGTRTLAILTKPDLIDPGAEKNVLEIVHNRVIFLNMGYVIVKCRGQKQIDENMSITHAIEEELEFFRNHEHFRSLLREEKATTKCLATKLSNALVKQIKVSPTKHPTFICSPYTKCTLENMWSDHEVVHQVVDEYDQKHRGTELPGFSNYRVFQHVVQKLVAKLKIPAMTTLQKIRGNISLPPCIQDSLCPHGFFIFSNIVKARIGEQFEMEMLVYTQDEIFNKHLPKEEKAEGSDHNTRSKYPGLLKSYYEVQCNTSTVQYIVVQRLADQVPMLIHYFILKESAKIVCSEMLDLLHRDDTDIILQEDSEIGQYRAKLQAQADRLLLANDKISRHNVW
uniref:Interferon-induced GTP-binding protein Mx n=1 Tax=Hucho hucho TaxID=62062 RepID=A0A4W5R6Z8_9TELE